jgi:hypothetical protein
MESRHSFANEFWAPPHAIPNKASTAFIEAIYRVGRCEKAAIEAMVGRYRPRLRPPTLANLIFGARPTDHLYFTYHI